MDLQQTSDNILNAGVTGVNSQHETAIVTGDIFQFVRGEDTGDISQHESGRKTVGSKPKFVGKSSESKQEKSAEGKRGKYAEGKRSNPAESKRGKSGEGKISKPSKSKEGNSVASKNLKSPKGEKKIPSQPKTSEMVVESIHRLRTRNGATEESISKYIEENYDVDIRARNRRIKLFLKNGVEKGLLEKVGGDGIRERYKLKKENAKKATGQKRNLAEEQKNVKKVKKSVAVPERKSNR